MFETITEALRQWNKSNNDRAKMQHAYFTAIIIVVVVSGLTSLLNVELGRQILALATILGAVFLVNAIVWALLQTFVTNRLSTPTRPAAKATTTVTKTTKK